MIKHSGRCKHTHSRWILIQIFACVLHFHLQRLHFFTYHFPAVRSCTYYFFHPPWMQPKCENEYKSFNTALHWQKSRTVTTWKHRWVWYCWSCFLSDIYYTWVYVAAHTSTGFLLSCLLFESGGVLLFYVKISKGFLPFMMTVWAAGYSGLQLTVVFISGEHAYYFLR